MSGRSWQIPNLLNSGFIVEQHMQMGANTHLLAVMPWGYVALDGDAGGHLGLSVHAEVLVEVVALEPLAFQSA